MSQNTKLSQSLACFAAVSLLFIGIISITPAHAEQTSAKVIMAHLSPLKQYMAGTNLKDIQCDQGLQLIMKSKAMSPACVKPSTASKLVSLGWGKLVDDTMEGSDQDQPSTKTVTLDDNGKSVSIKKGQSFLLKLGEAYNWDINIDDQSVASRVMNVMVIKGAQGLYQGHNIGQTTLSATGNPWCYTEKPACMMPSILFKLDIMVTE